MHYFGHSSENALVNYTQLQYSPLKRLHFFFFFPSFFKNECTCVTFDCVGWAVKTNLSGYEANFIETQIFFQQSQNLATGCSNRTTVLKSLSYFPQFRQYIDQDITRNYRHDDILVNVGRVALALTLLLSFPLLIFPCRAVINRVWHNLVLLDLSRLALAIRGRSRKFREGGKEILTEHKSPPPKKKANEKRLFFYNKRKVGATGPLTPYPPSPPAKSDLGYRVFQNLHHWWVLTYVVL